MIQKSLFPFAKDIEMQINSLRQQNTLKVIIGFAGVFFMFYGYYYYQWQYYGYYCIHLSLLCKFYTTAFISSFHTSTLLSMYHIFSRTVHTYISPDGERSLHKFVHVRTEFFPTLKGLMLHYIVYYVLYACGMHKNNFSFKKFKSLLSIFCLVCVHYITNL